MSFRQALRLALADVSPLADCEWVILSGFMGRPQDWDPLVQEFSQTRPLQDLRIVDLQEVYRDRLVSWPLSWQEWPGLFAKYYPQKRKQRWLIGYSMGGRLGLSLLSANPQSFDGMVFMSTHPGLQTEIEKKERLLRDEAWAVRFEGRQSEKNEGIDNGWGCVGSQDWEVLMDDWNQQEVLQSSPPMDRQEDYYDRQQLACFLRAFSLGHQADYRPLLEEACRRISIQWCVGERDLKFCRLAQELCARAPLIRLTIFPGVGHRIFF
jgi:2-succinyl-6-hydroxy-2,4-cyclohexadiene-1-carboxylate synthase